MKLINSLRNNKFKKEVVISAILASLLIFIGSAHRSYALFGIGNIATGALSEVAEWIAYVLAWIFGAFIAIEAWLIGVVLNINAGVMQTSFVQTGFSISLSVANLAFVLGIIVIALATILRIENYSIKKMLWKLVIMAILVNFGLVIIAPIFQFSNSVTQYFLNSFPGGGGASSFNQFAKTMSGKFNPSAMFAPPADSTQGSANNLAPFGLPAVGDVPIGATLIPIFSLVFTVVDFLLIVFVLGAFIIMLMIRYIYIAILAILLPFAWASWVFPSFSSMYSKWWNKFLQWTFFGPIFMFFLYLALATMGGANNADALNTTNYVSTGNDLFSSILSFFGSGIQPIVTNLLQEMVLGGLILGGMVAADSMGIKFAGTVMKGVENVGKAAQGYVGRKTKEVSKKAGRAAFRGVGGERALNAMREGRLGGLEGVPGFKWAASRAASSAASAITPHMSNSDLVEAQKKNVSKDPSIVKSELKGNLSTEKILARIAALTESGDLDEDTMVGNQKVGAWKDAHKEDVANYGFTKSSKDADKALGSNEAMRTAAAGMTAEDLNDPAFALAAGQLRDATTEFVRGLKGEDIAKLNVNKMFDPKNNNNPIQAELARAFATDGPGDAAKAIGKMTGATKANFKKVYEAQIGEAQKTPGLSALAQAAGEVNALQESKNNNPDMQRLRDEIAKIQTGPGFQVDKDDQIREKNEELVKIAGEIDKKIEDAGKKREAAEKLLTDQDRNVQSALKYFRASLDANATFGGADPAIAAAAAATGTTPGSH